MKDAQDATALFFLKDVKDVKSLVIRNCSLLCHWAMHYAMLKSPCIIFIFKLHIHNVNVNLIDKQSIINIMQGDFMPTSYASQISKIIKLIININPISILDIGIGCGKYGFLSREYLEPDYLFSKNYEKIIDGIEGFENYITPVHKYIYNNIYIGNALDILPTLDKKYDLILLIDIFEHFKRNDGLKLIDECKKHSKNIIISVPKHMGSQDAVFGNDYEIHETQWLVEDFNLFFKNKFFIKDKHSIICYAGEDVKRIIKYDYSPFRSIHRKMKKIKEKKALQEV